MKKFILLSFLLIFAGISHALVDNGSIGCDGVNDGVATSTSSAICSLDFTVETNIWVNAFEADDGGKNQIYIHYNYINFQIRGDAGNIGKIAIVMDDPAAYKYSTATLQLHKWHHIAWTYTETGGSGVSKIYIDGKLDSTHSGNDLAVTYYYYPNYLVGIGCQLNITVPTARYFNGWLDNTRKWNYDRSANQIEAWAWTPITDSAHGLVQNMKFNKMAGRYEDSSGYSNHSNNYVGTFPRPNVKGRRTIGE